MFGCLFRVFSSFSFLRVSVSLFWISDFLPLVDLQSTLRSHHLTGGGALTRLQDFPSPIKKGGDESGLDRIRHQPVFFWFYPARVIAGIT